MVDVKFIEDVLFYIEQIEIRETEKTEFRSITRSYSIIRHHNDSFTDVNIDEVRSDNTWRFG